MDNTKLQCEKKLFTYIKAHLNFLVKRQFAMARLGISDVCGKLDEVIFMKYAREIRYYSLMIDKAKEGIKTHSLELYLLYK